MTVQDIKKNGWNEWAKHVLITLEDLKEQHEKADKKIGENREDFLKAIGEVRSDIKVLENRMATRSVLAGAVSGLVPAVIALIWMLVKMAAITPV